MNVSDVDLASLVFLDAVERGSGIPDDCDTAGPQAQGLVIHDAAGWALTPEGHLRLRNLRSVSGWLPQDG